MAAPSGNDTHPLTAKGGTLSGLSPTTTLTQERDASINQRLRVRIGDDDRPGRPYRQCVEECLCHVCSPTCPLQEADDFALVVGNRKLIEGTNAAGDEDHDVGTPYGNDVAPFEPKARVDHNRRGVRWCVVQRGVLDG